MGGDEGSQSWIAALFGRVGRLVLREIPESAVAILQHLGGVWHLFVQSLYYSFVAPFTGRTKLRKQLFPMMSNVGVRSLPIVSLISALMGATLVLQTGDTLESYGQVSEVPGVVAISMARELGPLMTAIILTARVGASFTAVLASMKINDEVMALETMAIHPVGYLVAPRFLSMVIMVPCLTVFSYLVGMVGGSVVAFGKFGISFATYVAKTQYWLTMTDVFSGLVKAMIFGVIIAMVCCYYGLITEGGPMGLGRNTMVAVVTSLVVVILADTVTTLLFVLYLY